MKVERFEDLECWKEARKLVNLIYEITNKYPFSKDFVLRDQIRSAGVSIMNNIAEGFDSQSNAELVRFLGYSRRSTSEVINCSYIALDQKYITENVLNHLLEQSQKTRQIVDGFLRYLRKHKRT